MLTDFSGTSSSSLAQDLQQVFQITSQRIGISGVRPMIFLPQEELASPRMIEEHVLSWFCKQGFDGERDRKSNIAGLFPTNGYTELFERLVEMPNPLAQENLDQTLRQELNSEFAAIYGTEWSGDERRERLEHIFDILLRSRKRLQNLAEVIESVEVIENLHSAIIQDDAEGFFAGRVVAGTPDLFLWHPDITLHLWFFVEVKGPGDSLRKSQSIWLKRNWQQIQGRAILVHVL